MNQNNQTMLNTTLLPLGIVDGKTKPVIRHDESQRCNRGAHVHCATHPIIHDYNHAQSDSTP